MCHDPCFGGCQQVSNPVLGGRQFGGRIRRFGYAHCLRRPLTCIVRPPFCSCRPACPLCGSASRPRTLGGPLCLCSQLSRWVCPSHRLGSARSPLASPHVRAVGHARQAAHTASLAACRLRTHGPARRPCLGAGVPLSAVTCAMSKNAGEL